ncbi:unnamed protein product [Trifolium pratense]|uniref:Uncharacterized protein n=1 Tax=Trifolium pratense TaxID=57577 RepID=A0ACB0INZ4_TRIPR|nr:unnamed protein product [Trifolium pratense]
MTETCHYTIIKVVRDEDLAEQIGKDIYFDLVDFDKVRSFRVKKYTSFHDFKEYVANEFGIPARFQSFWIWTKRENQSFRPLRPLTHIEEAGTVRQLIKLTKADKAAYHLFLQVEHGLDLCPIAPLNKRKDDDILLFFKLYDPEKEELRYVGRLFVKCSGKPSEILTKLNNLAGYDSDEEIELYEEIMFEPNVMCYPVDEKLTFNENQLENGDIICFQKASEMVNEKHLRYPDVPSFLEYVHSQVSFSSSDTESKDEESVSESSEKEIKNIIDSDEIEAMIAEDAIGAIDRVLAEGISVSLQSMHSIQVSRQSLKVQELRDIVFKEDLFEKFKEGLTPNVIFNAFKEKIDANAYVFSSRQLGNINAVVNLLNNIVRMLEKLENLNKVLDSAKKSTDQNNEALKVKRQKILASNTSSTIQQTRLNQITDPKAKIAMKSLNNEVKSIFHRLADDHIKLKRVEDKIQEAQTDLESHEKLYQFFRENPPF